MKKTLKITALALVILSFTIMLVACTFDTYESRLIDAGYDVERYEDEALLDEQERFEKMGYEIKEYLIATKISISSFEVVTIIKFNTTKEAQRYIDEELIGTEAVRQGAVVLLGSENAKNTALGNK